MVDTERKAATIKELEASEAACKALLGVLSDSERVTRLKRNKDFHMGFLGEAHGVGADELEQLHAYARLLFECGQYARAAPLLANYRALAGNDGAHSTSALWGRLACDVLQQRTESALSQLRKLKELVDGKGGGAAAERLHKRIWLAHWGLFVFFGHANGVALACEWFFDDDKYLQAMRSAAPHLMRYVAAAAVLSPRSRQLVRELMDSIERPDDALVVDDVRDASDRDPIIRFMRRLLVLHDFAGAREALAQCSTMLKADFFLAARHDDFMQSARVLVFEAYCRVHERVDIALLASQLDLDASAAERWLVDMIRDARLDAKIDAAQNQIVLPAHSLTPHERVVAKTKGLAFRSGVLFGNLERLQAK